MARKSKKKSKEEKRVLELKEMWLGGMIVLFVGIWTYYNSIRMALLIIGMLIFLTGLMRCRKR